MGKGRVCSGVVVPGIVSYPYGTFPVLNQANFQAVFYTKHMEVGFKIQYGGAKTCIQEAKGAYCF